MIVRIKTITITGADNHVDIGKLVELQQQYPLVEWGILLSPVRKGVPRYPDNEWVSNLKGTGLRLSLHICGKSILKILAGDWSFLEADYNKPIAEIPFERHQINMSHYDKEKDYSEFCEGVKKKGIRNPIIQWKNTDSPFIDQAIDLGVDFAILYDRSGGIGKTPECWQKPAKVFTGYAGGLGPDNVLEQLKKIEEQVEDREIWIDCETKVRDNNDEFDLDKVKKYLDTVLTVI